MPQVNIKVVKSQINFEKKKLIIEGITKLIVEIMERNRDYTVVTIDEMDDSQWAIGGKFISEFRERKVSAINIRVSKGTVTQEQSEKMIIASKALMKEVLGGFDETNYFVIEELNPDNWGFDDITMSERRKREQH